MSINSMTEAGTVPAWTVGDRLRKARERLGLHQSEFADLIGISRNSVVRAEKSETPPRRPILVSWSLATGTPLAWLETGINEESPSGGPEGQAEPGAGAGRGVRAKGFEPPTFCSVAPPLAEVIPFRRVSAEPVRKTA